MPKVTALKPQRYKKNYFNVYLDEKFAFSLTDKQVAEYGLKVGQILTLSEIEKIAREDVVNKVYNKVLRFLGYRYRSEKEIRNFLARYDLDNRLKDQLLLRLKKLGFVNDNYFAQWWLENRLRFKPKGKIALKADLIKKGIDKEFIDHILSQLDETLERDLAHQVASKQLEKYQHLPKPTIFKKLAALLLRRGFSWDVVDEVLGNLGLKEFKGESR